MGGPPNAVPDRCKEASANAALLPGVAQILIWGDHEDYVPQPLAEQYVSAATRAGGRARLVLVPAVGHFETASSFTPAWPAVREAIRSLLLN